MPQFPLTDLLQINTEDEMSWYVYTLHSAWNPEAFSERLHLFLELSPFRPGFTVLKMSLFTNLRTYAYNSAKNRTRKHRYYSFHKI